MVGKYFVSKNDLFTYFKVEHVGKETIYGKLCTFDVLTQIIDDSFTLKEIEEYFTEISEEEWNKVVTKACSNILNSLLHTKFRVGDKVYKSKGDYTFDGEIVGVIQKRNGAVRVVAELDGRGLLHIFSENQLELKQTYEPEEFIEGLA